jgi:hypothetical protein
MNIHHKEFEYYFLQSFLSKKVKVNIENLEKQNYFFNLSKHFQLSGYLLNSIEFSENTNDLKEKLVKLNSYYLKKILLMRYEILKIVSLFDKNNIEYVVLKGMAIEIKEIDSCRQFRDLDILIKQKDLKKAYKLLKTSGYTYFNNDSNDGINYIRDKHHIPPMVNDARIVVELHHRITKASIFKSCPLTGLAFHEKEKCNGINIPSDKFLLAHTIYHGILHNKLNPGPIFLLDIKSILENNPEADAELPEILKGLCLNDEYILSKSIIEACKNKHQVDEFLLKKFNDLFNDGGIFSIDINRINISLSGLIEFVRSNSYSYQLPYWSPKLIIILFKRIYKRLFA